jgi:hypothetical protein
LLRAELGLLAPQSTSGAGDRHPFPKSSSARGPPHTQRPWPHVEQQTPNRICCRTLNRRGSASPTVRSTRRRSRAHQATNARADGRGHVSWPRCCRTCLLWDLRPADSRTNEETADQRSRRRAVRAVGPNHPPDEPAAIAPLPVSASASAVSASWLATCSYAARSWEPMSRTGRTAL